MEMKGGVGDGRQARDGKRSGAGTVWEWRWGWVKTMMEAKGAACEWGWGVRGDGNGKFT